MTARTIKETEQEIRVYEECDVLVVGGGAAGHSAALAAARAGAKNVILMERYGFMGGDATGGYVIMVPNLSWYDKSFVRGIQEEWFTRMEHIPQAVLGPSLEKIGSTSPMLLQGWQRIHDCVSRGGFEGAKPSCLVRSVYFEPNELKIEMDLMLYEERDRIKVMYHSWGAKPIIEENRVAGVIFESKEGRMAVMAKIVIDATGDGDLFTRAGVPYATLSDGETRSNKTALVWRIGGINWALYNEWEQAHPNAARTIWPELKKLAGFNALPLPSNRNDICWVNNWHENRDCSTIKDLTETEINTRINIRKVIEFLREAVPAAFEHAFLYDIAPQTGLRCSKRLKGEYIMSPKDFAFETHFDDVIAWHSTICQINDCGPVEIPYRAILPQKIDGLLCPGRHLSADNVSIDWLNLIPQCVGTGQAAGVAAAVAIQQGTGTHDVDIRTVQDILVEQDVPLPRNEKFHAIDPTYQECVEEHQYGLYTALAAKYREEGDNVKVYHW